MVSAKDYYQTEGGDLPVRWMSPEAVGYGKFSSASDVWAFGVTVWEVFSYGVEPFSDMSNMDVCEALAQDKLPTLDMPPFAPPVFSDLLHACMQKVPQSRPSMIDLVKMLQDYMLAASALDERPPVFYEDANKNERRLD